MSDRDSSAEGDSDSMSSHPSWEYDDRSPGAKSDEGDDEPFWTDDLDGYPLDVEDTYGVWPALARGVATPNPWKPPSRAPSVDLRARQYRALYDLDLLDRQRPLSNTAATLGPGLGLGVLRKRWQHCFQRAGNGEWNYVEYAPAWTDPNWDERYVWTGTDAPPWPADHPLAKQYALPGLMQTLRPALRDSDRRRNPSATAKRWGFYPYRTGQTQRSMGSSGATPTQPGFPTVPLDIPTWSYAKNQVWHEVTVDDLKAARDLYDSEMRAVKSESTDEGFRRFLEDTANSFPWGSEAWDQADKLLQLFDLRVEQERRHEYQRMLFSGNTTNEVRMSGHEFVLSIFSQERSSANTAEPT